MRFNPDALDYEGVFPGRAGRRPENDAASEVWPTPPAIEETSPRETSTPKPIVLPETERWLRRRGHTISFALLFLFSIILYYRPYEMIPALSGLTQMAFYTGVALLAVYAGTQLSIEGNLTARPREVNLALLLLVAALLSMPLAVSPADAWEKFSEMLLKTILIFIVIVNVVRTELRLRMLLVLVLAVSIYLSINAINDYRTGVFGTGALESHDARIAGRRERRLDIISGIVCQIKVWTSGNLFEENLEVARAIRDVGERLAIRRKSRLAFIAGV